MLFARRDKTLNYFNIMLKKRVKNEDKDAELDEEEKAAKTKTAKSKKKTKDFVSVQIFCRASFFFAGVLPPHGFRIVIMCF